LSPAEFEYIVSNRPKSPPKIKWGKLLAYRQTWAFVAGKFATDPIWWFLLFWIPDFLQRNHGLKLMQIGLPIMVIYILADIGSVAGGWCSSSMIHRGRSVNRSRKTAMLVCALSVVPIVFAYRVQSLWGAVLLIGLAAAAHQGFSANLFSLSSDIFPAQAVGSVVGIGGMAEAIGGMLMEIFGTDMTMAVGTCRSCGAVGGVAELAVYMPGLGIVVRCRNCGAVLMVFVRIREITCVDLEGLASLS
jgi:ACS family hexuronate transporter-like MFS transporter